MAHRQILNKLSVVKISNLKSKNLVKIPYLKFILVALGINLLAILFVVAIKKKLPPEVPLFYGLAEGAGQLASSLSLTLPAAISLIILLLNFIIASLTENEFLQQTLIIASFACALFALVTTLRISFLVTSF